VKGRASARLNGKRLRTGAGNSFSRLRVKQFRNCALGLGMWGSFHKRGKSVATATTWARLYCLTPQAFHEIEHLVAIANPP
jgi:hypothetical protein